MCHSPELAARHIRISCQMAYYHRKHDSEFAKQWDEAREYGIEMLHARAFQRSLEGDLEPVYYMGRIVDYVRKFDSRLQIEMLRAHRPDKFKTAGVEVNLATKGDVFVLTEAQRHELMEINRERIKEERAKITGDPCLSPLERHLESRASVPGKLLIVGSDCATTYSAQRGANAE